VASGKIPASINKPLNLAMRTLFSIALCALPALALAAPPTYELTYTARFRSSAPIAEVSIALGANAERVKSLTLNLKDPKRYGNFSGDGAIEVDGKSVRWTPRGNTPKLRYTHQINHIREDGAHDARWTPKWALLRGDDLVPQIRARTAKGASSRATLKFELPAGWSAETAWTAKAPLVFTVQNPRRRFDRPTGWMVVGDIGTRRDLIDGTEVVVSGPVGEGPRRQDILAFMNWTLPEYRAAFGELSRKFLIVGAAEQMWRGGLSGPNSFYFHPDRPLISENGTSSLLHELVHTVQRIKAAPRHDWIVEGLAEFYAIELLHRSGGSSDERYARTHDWLRDWGKGVKSIYTSRSTGEITARSVGIFKALDEEIRSASKNKQSLDRVVREMMAARDDVSLKQLRSLSEKFAGRPLKSLSDTALPGDETVADR
jgi:hypothetical protein